jgi:diguanylate cyclase (GGDEF)-like protein
MNKTELVEILNQQPFGIAEFTSLEGNYLFFNEQERILRKLSFSEMQSVSLFDLFVEEDSEKLRAIFKQCAASSTVQEYFFKYQSNEHKFQMRIVKSDNGNIISSLTDITNLHQLEELQLVDKEGIKCLSDAIEGANIGCWDYYPQEDRIIANKTWVTQKKYKDEDFRVNTDIFSDVIDGLTKWASIVHPDDLEATSKLIEKHLHGETDVYDAKFRMMCGDGQWRWFHDIGRVFLRDENGTAIRMNGVHIDITEFKKLETDIKKLSITDSLTGLLNRRKFEFLFNNTITESRKNKELCCFLFIDIDLFKKYNDIYGHQEGDKALKRVGEVIRNTAHRSEDYCFRLGGEEFGVVFNSGDMQAAITFSKLIKNNIECLRIPHLKNTASKYLTASMGLYCNKHDERIDMNQVYKRADELLYKAKEAGRNMLKVDNSSLYCNHII